ncbi:ornithine cyclodeaminase/alanine dehydrogenase-like protein (mu-crystallin family) [Fontibacillus solani]|uniref:Ornithine cyclodeaminase/alanine dehydrogenase-like protein (Mu-crystallin family) n=1 Tax=Fontibacillus solani TaxID=1572857 RepID=A0A7W3XUH9_9BACL|nr:hypothetical protein [Fontibacillus solani]MBA9088683.1 ornithine cyclodeaminase/alanine dehydrogenase-like protein (mu-crystallin family) [Fontibacillus solani]
MLYLDDSHIRRMDIKWWELIHTIEKVAYSLETLEYAQPLKPYLRFGDSKNRIIAMPAYVGNDIHAAGIKWIASFPDNIKNGIKRAHSITILNDPDTGEPLTVMNTPDVSIIRTAAVTGTMLKHYLLVRELQNVTVGIIGLGPVGEAHYKLIRDMIGHTVERVLAYDLMEERLNGFIVTT